MLLTDAKSKHLRQQIIVFKLQCIITKGAPGLHTDSKCPQQAWNSSQQTEDQLFLRKQLQQQVFILCCKMRPKLTTQCLNWNIILWAIMPRWHAYCSSERKLKRNWASAVSLVGSRFANQEGNWFHVTLHTFSL